MKRVLSSFIISLWSVYINSQSVYMHEAQEDSQNTGPISFLGIITLAIIIGIIWIISSIRNDVKKHNEIIKHKNKSVQQQLHDFPKNSDEFVCPVCNKHIIDRKFTIISYFYKNDLYHVKLCTTCGGRYSTYEEQLSNYLNHKNEPPEWASCTLVLISIGTGIYALIRNFINGEYFSGLLGLFICPIGIGGILGGVLWLFQQIMKPIKPNEPFKIPPIEHIRECNAIYKI